MFRDLSKNQIKEVAPRAFVGLDSLNSLYLPNFFVNTGNILGCSMETI